MSRPLPPPVPVVLRSRAFPAVPPRRLTPGDPFPRRVIVAEAALGPGGRAISGVYVGDGPELEDVGGRFLGPGVPPGLDPSGPGPVRTLEDFLDRIIWRLMYEARFGFVAWDPAALFSSLAFTFRKGGRWAILWTYSDGAGRRLVDYFRPPIVLDPLANGLVAVRFGPRKNPDPRDFVAGGGQWPGRFASLRDAVSALVGERVEDLSLACRLFDVPPPSTVRATPETPSERVVALRHLYRAVRAEAESWPG